jgi:hypothetical protein
MYIFYHVLSTDDCEEMERQMDRWIENDRKNRYGNSTIYGSFVGN